MLDETERDSQWHYPAIRVEGLVAGYGGKSVINDVSFTVPHGAMVAVVGHNGAGKSTLLKVIFGLLPAQAGRVYFDNEPARSARPSESLRSGVVYVPQGNRVFGDLTVMENLQLGSITLGRQAASEAAKRVLNFFASLKSRLSQRAETLSGGEKQMLALAMALVRSPKILLLDEPSLGLSSSLIRQTFTYVKRLSQENAVTILIVEQKVREIVQFADRVLALRNGVVVFDGQTDAFAKEANLKKIYLQ